MSGECLTMAESCRSEWPSALTPIILFLALGHLWKLLHYYKQYLIEYTYTDLIMHIHTYLLEIFLEVIVYGVFLMQIKFLLFFFMFCALLSYVRKSPLPTKKSSLMRSHKYICVYFHLGGLKFLLLGF